MKAQSGFTLVELVLVTAIIGILLAAVTSSFLQLNQKYSVESYTKDIFTILMQARNDATNINTTCTVTLAANEVRTVQDKNQDGDTTDQGELVIHDFPRFAINSASPVVFDRRGLTNDLQTIRITGYSAKVEPTMDCIVIAATRINIGKWTGGTCVQR
jgi:prepilin-type N-terminal cleavage/methylation domain-containing protein